jgi:pyruvate formate lyase activating enzyme
MKEARYYKIEENDTVRCGLCGHNCVIKSSKRGICRVRENQKGKLYSLVYGKMAAMNNDPIEKKPLFHVLPGSDSLSIASVGCNFRCDHCQNYSLSQYSQESDRIPGEDASPESVVEAAVNLGSQTISFTYSEPTIFFEWAQDIAQLAATKGIKCVSVTNGYISSKPLEDIAPNLLAANVDLKAFDAQFYKKVCKAKLQPVLDTIALMSKLGIWVEVTTLIIPGLNDDPGQLKELAEFIVSVNPAIPWHISRFHPDYKMRDRQATPLATIQKAREIGYQAGLRFVYSGNVWGDEGESTFCPACGTKVIERRGFSIMANQLVSGGCANCGEKIEGVWTQ